MDWWKNLCRFLTACINDWTEIAFESDLDAVSRAMGRLGHFTQRFCLSKTNLPFCGQLLLQYTMLAALRNRVRGLTMEIVGKSVYFNQPFKAGGLIR